MFRGRTFAVAAFAVVITAGLTASASAQAAGSGRQAASLHAVTMSYQKPASPLCLQMTNLRGWGGIYSACTSISGTYLRLTNTSVWDDLILQVRRPSAAFLVVSEPDTGSALLNLAEELEFPGRVSTNEVVVPPGSTLTATSLNESIVRLSISVDQYHTPWNVAAEGLADTIQGHVFPAWSEADSIVGCANYVHSLPGQLNQWQPSSPEFWNSMVSALQCRDAFHGWSDLFGGGEKTIIDDAEHDTDPFFDYLFRFLDLAGEEIFH
jgi:hypothetical protein